MPNVLIVLVIHNDASRLSRRLENLLAQDYPPNLRRIVVVSDGSSDDPRKVLSAFDPDDLKLVERPIRCGKAACLNVALAAPEAPAGEIVVFADARQSFDGSTIRRLIERFADPAIGAVSGALEIQGATSNVGQAVDTYWKSEKALREAEANYDSCIGCTGAVYAIRRALFTAVPEDTLLDDVVIPMQIALQGYRVVFERAAVAFDPQPLEPSMEIIRKRRTLAGNFQMLFRYPEWLLPWRNRLWWQLLSHKYLRLLAPGFLLLAWLSSGLLCAHPLYQSAFVLQSVLYVLAVLGIVRPSLRQRAVAIPAGFVFLNAATVRAFWHYCTDRDLHRWQRPT